LVEALLEIGDLLFEDGNALFKALINEEQRGLAAAVMVSHNPSGLAVPCPCR